MNSEANTFSHTLDQISKTTCEQNFKESVPCEDNTDPICNLQKEVGNFTCEYPPLMNTSAMIENNFS